MSPEVMVLPQLLPGTFGSRVKLHGLFPLTSLHSRGYLLQGSHGCFISGVMDGIVSIYSWLSCIDKIQLTQSFDRPSPDKIISVPEHLGCTLDCVVWEGQSS